MADLISSRGTAQPPNSLDKYKSDWQVDEGYIVTLRVQNDKTVGGIFSVSTSLDESFGLSLRSEWSAPYANAMSDALDRGAARSDERNGNNRTSAKLDIARRGADAMGWKDQNKSTTAQVWQSSTPISFNIPFTFIAQTDAKIEVQDKVMNLLKLTAPSEKLGMIQAPGPTIAGQAKQLVGASDRRITLQIGKFLFLDNCIVNGVDVQFDSIIGVKGIPHKAKVTVDIASYYTCFTVQDIDNLFAVKG